METIIITQGDHEIPATKFKDNLMIFQGSFHDFQGCQSSTETQRFNGQVLQCASEKEKEYIVTCQKTVEKYYVTYWYAA